MSEQLFVLNPKIERYSKRYIWGTDKEAFLLLCELTTHRISVDGFISNDMDQVGMVLINKPVISLSMIKDQEDTLIITGLECQPEIFWRGDNTEHFMVSDIPVAAKTDVITNIYTFHELFIAENVVIYGAGYVGEKLIRKLCDRGIKVDYFLDGNKSGQKLSGIPIYHPQKINEMDDDVVVIEAGKYWQEMDDKLRKAKSKIQTFYVEKIPNRQMKIRIIDHELYSIQQICFFSEAFPECFHGRKVIMLGNDLGLAKGYKEVLECLGYINVSMMVTDEAISCVEAPLLDEILYEENYLLLLYERNKSSQIIKKIEELGIADEDWSSVALPQPLGHKEFVLDLNLGNTYKMNYIPGIYLHGEEKDSNVKIVTLGGSTTDEEVYLIPSWPKIMFEKYCKEHVTLYNGGTDAHASSQELIKLIRDILYLKPDIIITYDGFNDGHKIEFQFLYNLLDYLKDDVYDYGILHQKIGKDIFTGINSDNVLTKWLTNIESMYAVSSIRNIKFFSFIQPMTVSQKITTKHGMALQKMCYLFLNQEKVKNMQLFRERGKEIEKTHPYIHDLSHIFDEKDVYMDYCHVWEIGNEIVADSIWEVIEPSVKEIMEMKRK